MSTSLVRELKDLDAVLRQTMQEFKQKVTRLEERMDKLEKSKAIAYRGAFSPEEEYAAGEYVSRDGLWCAIRDTRAGEAPGRSASWRLAIKA